MNVRVRTIFGIVLMGLAASAVGADDSNFALSDLHSGDRVKVRREGEGKTLVGAIEKVTGDELVVRVPGVAAPFRLSLSQLQSLEVARGTRSQWRRGAVIGFVPGALVVGWTSGVLACEDLNGC